jgi:hypothetical protein
MVRKMKFANLSLFLIVAGSAFLGTACSTIYFHNGPTRAAELENVEWHHDGILRLVEFSSPVDLNDRCESKPWTTVKVEKTFIQGFVGGVSYGLYDPWNVEFSCKR